MAGNTGKRMVDLHMIDADLKITGLVIGRRVVEFPGSKADEIVRYVEAQVFSGGEVYPVTSGNLAALAEGELLEDTPVAAKVGRAQGGGYRVVLKLRVPTLEPARVS